MSPLTATEVPVIDKSSFLRNVLVADAVMSAATGALLILGSGMLTSLLSLPRELLIGAGLVLVPYVALVAWVAARKENPAPAVRLVVALNFIWALASVAILLTGLVTTSVLGGAFIVIQAAAVALLGELQLIGLKRRLVPA
jgi:hypothetical protein